MKILEQWIGETERDRACGCKSVRQIIRGAVFRGTMGMAKWGSEAFYWSQTVMCEWEYC